MIKHISHKNLPLAQRRASAAEARNRILASRIMTSEVQQQLKNLAQWEQGELPEIERKPVAHHVGVGETVDLRVLV